MTQHFGIFSKRKQTSGLPTRNTVLSISLVLNGLLSLTLLYWTASHAVQKEHDESSSGKRIPRIWHGGHPNAEHSGSCWCGDYDGYCLCTPQVSIDVVIIDGKNCDHLWLVRRKDTNQLAVMGGFVDVDENIEHAVFREIKEEMNVDLTKPPILFGVYGDLRRDNRRHTVSVVYAVHLDEDANPRAGDDAKEVHRISLDQIEDHTFYADHKTILLDYRRFINGEDAISHSEGDFASDIVRSTCARHAELRFKKSER